MPVYLEAFGMLQSTGVQTLGISAPAISDPGHTKTYKMKENRSDSVSELPEVSSGMTFRPYMIDACWPIAAQAQNTPVIPIWAPRYTPYMQVPMLLSEFIR